MRSRWLKLLSVLAVLPALLALVATSYAGARCSMDGILRQKCCCPAPAADAEVPASGTVQATPCCSREVVHVTRVPSEPRRTTTDSLVVQLVLPALPLLLAPAPDQGPQRTGFPPPETAPAGRRLLLSKQVLLI